MILASGCGLRPSETVTYVIAVPGTPLRVLTPAKGNYVVKGQDLKSSKVVEAQKIDGWIAMPPEHWTVVKAKLNGVAKYEADNHLSILPLAEVVDVK